MSCPRCGGVVLRDRYGSKLCGRFCGWSYETYSLALAIVKFGARSARRPGTRDQAPWTPEEREVVRQLGEHTSFEDIGRLLNRTAASVRAEWRSMNPDRRKPYSRTRGLVGGR